MNEVGMKKSIVIWLGIIWILIVNALYYRQHIDLALLVLRKFFMKGNC